MRYQDDVRLSIPTPSESEALAAPLTLDASATFETAAIAKALVLESSCQCYITHVVRNLAHSPLWRLMCDELLRASADPEQFRLLFLAHSARLMNAGAAEAEDSE